ncbi:MAG: hypothetical protein ACRDOM_05330 [Nocardioides sp.]
MGRFAELDPRLVVATAASAAALLRFPGLFYPVGADEAGFTIVARHWDPGPEGVYGPYFLDRPPILVALVKLSDAVAGPYFLRLEAALGCALLVIVAAATAREALRYAGLTDARLISRTGGWTAVLTAAFTANAMIDPVMAKGEILGIPFVVASFWLALRSLNRPRVDGAALSLAGGAGLAALLALNMKQNLGAGLLFGAIVLVGARFAHRITTRQLASLGGAALLGAAVPLLATLGWAVSAGVRLDALWYAVFGFRVDAFDVVAAGSRDGPAGRALLLLGILAATGMAFVLAGIVIHRSRVYRLDRTLLVAAVSVVLLDLGGLWLGGSFWRQYLFVLVPGLVLCSALLLAVRVPVASRARALVVLAATTSALSSGLWASLYHVGVAPPFEVRSGMAIAEAARPGDSIVSYGGRADLVLASGLDAPYRHLWSLPMRTLDPGLEELRALLSGPDAPTWVVMMAPGYSWDHLADPIRPVLDARYRVHGQVCRDRYVYLLADLDRPPLTPEC